MDDRRIDSLIRMAAEIEELERSAERPALRLVHAPGSASKPGGTQHRRFRVLRVMPFAAAAACVGLAIYLAPRNLSTPVAPPTPVAVNPGESTRHPMIKTTSPRLTMEQARELMRRLEHPPEFASGVLAIFQDNAGVVRCVKWHPDNFGGRKLAELSPEDLVRKTYGTNCNVIGPHRVIAVGVSGLREKLPDSDERAQELAQCIVGEEALAGCGIEPPSFSTASASCVPTGLQVVVGTLAMGKH